MIGNGMMPKELVTIAALGTQNNGVRTLHLSSPTADFIAQSEREPLERHVLRLAGRLTLQQQAGWIPPVATIPPPPPCESDDRPPFSPTVTRYLEQMLLDGHFKRLLPEWFREVAASGKRAPVSVVIMLLEAGRHDRQLREMMMPVLGKRGVWLAEQADDQNWCWFGRQHVSQTWAAANDSMRLEIVQYLRKIDPSWARHLVEQTWDDTAEGSQRYLLQAFHDGLSIEDEPFLERIVAEGSVNSRMAAVLLSELAESGYIREIIEYVGRFLNVDPITKELHVIMGGSTDSRLDLPRGLREQYLLGALGGALVLSFVPPTIWLKQVDMNSEQLLTAISRHPKAQSLLEALVIATNRFRDVAFADVLLDYIGELNEHSRRPLYVTISPPRLEKLATQLLNQRGSLFGNSHPAVALLYLLEAPWGEDLAWAILGCMEQGVEMYDHLRGLLLRVARRIPIVMRDDLLRTLKRYVDQKRVLDAIEKMLDFREEMLRAIHDG